VDTESPDPRDNQLGDDAVAIARQLIRFDTTNWGPDERTKGEREAAEYVLGLLQDAGYEPVYIESGPGRGNVVLRIEGADQSRPALVVHGHLDVVPAEAREWQADPFGAEIRDGVLWGRGAVDMKDMDGMILAAALAWRRRGVKPPRDIVLAMFADEEAGGPMGSQWLVGHRPELFLGASEAVSEVGGFSVSLAGRRAYLIQTAEKGIAWLRLLARGAGGHGSAVNPDNAAAHLAQAMARIAAHAWPLDLTPTMRALLAGVAELTGLRLDLEDPAAVGALVEALGPAKRFVGASTSTRANVTSLAAGGKVNVIPATASGTVDLRPVPGASRAALAQIETLAGDKVAVEASHTAPALEAPFEAPLVEAMRWALDQADPGAATLPYMLAAGTDAKALAALGISGYGFAPLKLPPEFDFTAMFHGVDERVPVESLRWGAGVLEAFLMRS
jgi:acetylornithine deacetylase/succinyl-diaminopimelate desuccinylase-like protein